MKYYVFIFLLLVLISCGERKVSQKISLTREYISQYQARLDKYENQIAELKKSKQFEQSLEFQKRLETAEKLEMRASQEFEELIEDQNVQNKLDFEQELMNYQTVWDYIVYNYPI